MSTVDVTMPDDEKPQVKKTEGEEKAAKIGARGWHSGVASANYTDLWEKLRR